MGIKEASGSVTVPLLFSDQNFQLIVLVLFLGTQ